MNDIQKNLLNRLTTAHSNLIKHPHLEVEIIRRCEGLLNECEAGGVSRMFALMVVKQGTFIYWMYQGRPEKPKNKTILTEEISPPKPEPEPMGAKKHSTKTPYECPMTKNCGTEYRYFNEKDLNTHIRLKHPDKFQL